MGPYAKVYESIHIFSPSVDIDSAWEPVREFAKGLKEASFHSRKQQRQLRLCHNHWLLSMISLTGTMS